MPTPGIPRRLGENTFERDANRLSSVLGGSAEKELSVDPLITRNIQPASDDAYDIGTVALRYQDLYLSGNLYIRDEDLKVYSGADGYLDLAADTQVRINAQTAISGMLRVGSLGVPGEVLSVTRVDGTAVKALIRASSNDAGIKLQNSTEDWTISVDYGGADDGYFHIHNGGSQRLGISPGGSFVLNAAIIPSETFQIAEEGNASPGGQYIDMATDTAAAGPQLRFVRCRNSLTIRQVVQDDDLLGRIEWAGHDGSDWIQGAYIDAYVDGAPGSNDMPTRLVFATTADGDDEATEWLFLTEQGRFGVNSNAPGYLFEVYHATTNQLARFISADDTVTIILSDDDTDTYLTAKDSFLSLGGNTGLSAGNLNISTAGDVLVGTITGPSANGGKLVVLGDNVNDPTMGSNTAGVYGKDVGGTVEMFAVDEAGNATQLSPHDPLTGEWVFRTRNVYTGRELRVNMERLVLALDAMLGGGFVERSRWN